MKRLTPVSLFLILFFWTTLRSEAQLQSFHHLNRANGLSDNNVKSLTLDKDGYLWIGTADGLNVFDGYTITSFTNDQSPELPGNNFGQLTTDNSNRIWICGGEGISWADKKRDFHRIFLQNTIRKINGLGVIETRSYGIVLHTGLGQFYFNKTSKKWEPIPDMPARFRDSVFMEVQHFEDDKFIYVFQNDVVIYDYAVRKIIYEQPFFIPYTACRLTGDLIYQQEGFHKQWFFYTNNFRRRTG